MQLAMRKLDHERITTTLYDLIEAVSAQLGPNREGVWASRALATEQTGSLPDEKLDLASGFTCPRKIP